MANHKRKLLKDQLVSHQQVKREWDVWRKDKTHIKAKLHKDYIRLSDWFLTTHAASEAAL